MTGAFTRAQWAELPEGFHGQLLSGELVREPPPTYRHQSLVGRLHTILVGLTDPALVVLAPADVELDDHNVVQPDLAVLFEVPPLEATNVGIPRLAFEVLSPSTACRDRQVKAGKLLAAGVEEVWLLDPRSGSIERRSRVDGVASVVVQGREPLLSASLPGLALVADRLFDGLRS